MRIIEVKNLEEEGIEVYSSLTERQLRNNAGEGIIIVESPKVIKVALEEGYEPLSLLCERKHIEGDAAQIIGRLPQLTVYTGERETLAKLTGYKLTRGVLCAMRRQPDLNPEDICRDAKRIAVIEAVCDTTNIGSIFRSAAALGIDGILLTPDSCDPFNRRSIRVSMGSVFKVPWTFTDQPIEILKKFGFTTVALTLQEDSVRIDSPELKKYHRLAMVLGTEGDGLSEKIISQCDYKAIIPMHHNVDSLNVGAAAAVAFWELS
ncbi:MAG: RNA methyltransferase [Muribaculaceae bacterium]|nr:RNA methyltransferase [Muribaculaceae bacterium]